MQAYVISVYPWCQVLVFRVCWILSPSSCMASISVCSTIHWSPAPELCCGLSRRRQCRPCTVVSMTRWRSNTTIYSVWRPCSDACVTRALSPCGNLQVVHHHTCNIMHDSLVQFFKRFSVTLCHENVLCPKLLVLPSQCDYKVSLIRLLLLFIVGYS